MPNRPGYKPTDARLALPPRKRLQDALCRKALILKDENEHRRNTKIRDEWPIDEKDLRRRVRPAGVKGLPS